LSKCESQSEKNCRKFLANWVKLYLLKPSIVNSTFWSEDILVEMYVRELPKLIINVQMNRAFPLSYMINWKHKLTFVTFWTLFSKEEIIVNESRFRRLTDCLFTKPGNKAIVNNWQKIYNNNNKDGNRINFKIKGKTICTNLTAPNYRNTKWF